MLSERVIQSPCTRKKLPGYYLRHPKKKQCKYLSIIKIMTCSCFLCNKRNINLGPRCWGYVVLQCHLLEVLCNYMVTLFERLILYFSRSHWRLIYIYLYSLLWGNNKIINNSSNIADKTAKSVNSSGILFGFCSLDRHHIVFFIICLVFIECFICRASYIRA